MSTQHTTKLNDLALGHSFWYDPAVAQNDPSNPASLWVCSLRGMNDSVVCWAEAETPDLARSRARTITDSLNHTNSELKKLARVQEQNSNLLAALKEFTLRFEALEEKEAKGHNLNWREITANGSYDSAKRAIAKATGGSNA